MTEATDERFLNDEDMKKVVYKDDQDFKAIKGWIVDEDEHFITLQAIKSKLILRIGKGSIVIIRPSQWENEAPGMESGGVE